MKSSILQPTASQGLQPLRWLAFAVAAGGSYAALSASFTPNKVQVIAAATGSYVIPTYRFSVTSGVLPGWIKPGTPVNIAASVTVSGTSYNLSDAYVVLAVDPNGLYFDVRSPKNTRDGGVFNQALAATNVDNGSGQVGTPLVSLIMQFQKAMLSSSGSVTVAPCADASGNADYSFTVNSTSGEYELTNPYGSKGDLADWVCQGSGTLSVRFI